MNMLPHAVYGPVAWQEALSTALRTGEPHMVGGGEVDARRFLVAAILGSPALWAPAREAARMRRPRLAFRRAQRAMRRAFSGRLRYTLDGGAREKAEALVFMCPLTSKVMNSDEQALEAAALDPAGAAEAFRLGLSAMLGDWRRDASVETERCQVARVWAASGVPAILDGESVRLNALAEVRFRPQVVRILMTTDQA
jgi:diacylglycerol kinase family enzyme